MTDAAPTSKARLLDATFDLLWAGSFHSSGVDEICRCADVRKGSFYHHFSSKSELAIAALQANWESMQATLYMPIFEGELRGLAKFRALLKASDEIQRGKHAECGAFCGCPFGNLGQEMAGQDEGMRSAVTGIFDKVRAWFEQGLREAVELGEIVPGDLKRRAQSMLGLIQGSLLLAKLENSPDTFKNLSQGILQLALGNTEAAE